MVQTDFYLFEPARNTLIHTTRYLRKHLAYPNNQRLLRLLIYS